MTQKTHEFFCPHCRKETGRARLLKDERGTGHVCCPDCRQIIQSRPVTVESGKD